MNHLLIANLSFTAFFTVYMVVLRRFTFFGLNRFYLLFALVFSALSPFLPLDFWEEAGSGFLPVVDLPLLTVDGDHASVAPLGQAVAMAYWAGVAVAIAALLYTSYPLLRMMSRSRHRAHPRTHYYVAEGRHAFSFFHRIHIGEEVDHDMLEMILAHESVHRQQRHSLDVLLFAIARVLAWFNPFVYLAVREVRLNHEFLADRAVFGRMGTDYQAGLLNHAMNTRCFPLTNSFFSKNDLKNRIRMMNKKHSGKWSLAAYALIIPAIAGCLWLSACSDQAGIPDQNQKDMSQQEIMTAAGDGIVKKAAEVDKSPEFPGGEDGLLAYFKEGFEYPAKLKEAGVEGRCTLSFVVNEDGSISNVEAVKSDNKMLEEPAISFVENMPDWTPGEFQGKKVKVMMYLPVMYTMN